MFNNKKLPMPNQMDINPAGGFSRPQYPGQRAGISDDQRREFNLIKGLKVKGFVVSVPAGSSAFPVNINIQGNAWFLLGLSTHAVTNFDDDAAMPVSINLMINEEQVIDTMPWTTVDVKYMTNIYWPFERYLAGKDDITLFIDNTSKLEQDVALTFYYL
jgi:hypothetical protein